VGIRKEEGTMFYCSHLGAVFGAMFLTGTVVAEDYVCQVEEAQDFNERKTISHHAVSVPATKSKPESTVLYQKGDFQLLPIVM
jgi:hypothetical protein